MSTIAVTPLGTPLGTPRVAPRAASRVAQRQPRLRLTRRGRLVFGALIALPVALALAISALGQGAAQAGAMPSAVEFEYVTVAAGESLWELASWLAPSADPREVVAEIVSLNQLQTSTVQPGQRLAIPAAYSD